MSVGNTLETLMGTYIYRAPRIRPRVCVCDLSPCVCLTRVTPQLGVEGLKLTVSTVKLRHPRGHRAELTFHTQWTRCKMCLDAAALLRCLINTHNYRSNTTYIYTHDAKYYQNNMIDFCLCLQMLPSVVH